MYDYRAWELQRYGGVSRYFYEIIRHNVHSSNIDATVFGGLYQNKYGIKSIHGKNISVVGKEIPYFPKSFFLFDIVNELSFLSFSKLKSGYDIYHPTYYYSHRPPIRAAQVVTVFDMIHELFLSGRSSRRFRVFRDDTIKDKATTIRDADIVIAISHSTKKDLMDTLGVEERKIKVIYLANSLTAEVREMPLIDEPYILYVGGRGGYKNFRILLKAYGTSKRINEQFGLVTFAGEVSAGAEAEEMERLGVSERIRHINGDDSTLCNLYRYAQVLVFPSLYEGFGLPLLEAMHYGCPVIASNRASMPEVVGDAGILFDPDDEHALIDVLEKVLFDTGLRNRLIASGYRREKEFGWDIAAGKTLDVYKALV